MNSLDREAQSGVPRDKGEAASAAASGSAGSQGTKFPDESLLWGSTEETLRSRCPRGTWQGLATARHCLQGLGLKHAEQAAAPCLTPPTLERPKSDANHTRVSMAGREVLTELISELLPTPGAG